MQYVYENGYHTEFPGRAVHAQAPPQQQQQREMVDFEPNVPVQVAIKYSEPKIVSGRWGDRCMYSLVDGRVMFVEKDVAASINMMDISVRELFWICKRWNGDKKQKVHWDIWLDPVSEKARAAAERPAIEAELRRSIADANQKRYAEQLRPKPAPTAPAPTAIASASAVHQGWAQFLISQANALTDAYAACLSHARQQHGEAVKAEDVRTFVVTAFINQSKNGGGPNVA